MIWPTEFVVGVLTVITGILALQLKDLLASVVALAAYSFFMALLYIHLGAIDVGYTEVVVGAGVSGVLFIAAMVHLDRRSQD